MENVSVELNALELATLRTMVRKGIAAEEKLIERGVKVGYKLDRLRKLCAKLTVVSYG